MKVLSFLPNWVFLGVAFVTLGSWEKIGSPIINSEMAPESTKALDLQRPEPSPLLALKTQDVTVHITSVLDRPLFSQSRRPAGAVQALTEDTVEPEIEEQPSVSIATPGISLIGVFSGSERRALVRFLESGEERWVIEGARIGEWTIESIEGESLHITRHEQSHTYEMER